MRKWVVICKSHISSISPLLVQSCGSRSSDLIQSLLIRVSVLFLQNNCNNGTLWPSGDSVEPVPAGCCGELSTEHPPPPPRLGQEICTYYTQGGTLLLDGPKVFEMMLIEFGRAIQTLNPMVTQQWMDEVDDDRDRHLNMAECAKLVQRVSDSVQRPLP